jgi:hypothetical protein
MYQKSFILVRNLILHKSFTFFYKTNVTNIHTVYTKHINYNTVGHTNLWGTAPCKL